MEIGDYKPNSFKSKAEAVQAKDKKVEKVISGTAKTRKKSDIRKFTDVFVSEDIDNVKSYVISDVLVPAIKKTVVDVVTNTINMIFYGGTNGQASTKSTASKVSYRSYYDSKPETRGHRETRTITGYGYDDIVLESRGEAENVLERMDELIATYGMVSVADMYDLVDIQSRYTDNKYGWTDIRSAHIVRVTDGYVIKMPKALPID